METITKQSIAKSIFYETGFPTSMTLKIVDSIFNEIIDKLAEGEAVKISNFGSFNIKNKKTKNR